MRFLRLFTQRVCKQSTVSVSANSYRLPDYIYPECEQNYRMTMDEYKLAQQLLINGELDKANLHVDAAIAHSGAIDGETPAVMSIKISLNKLKNDIESERSVKKFQ